MSNDKRPKVTLIVTDADRGGRIQQFGFNKRMVPELHELVMEAHENNSAICIMYLPMEFDSWELWDERAGRYANGRQRPDTFFNFHYQKSQSTIGMSGAITWPWCDSEDSLEEFEKLLHGTHERHEEPVSVVIDCTDHPHTEGLLRGIGFEVEKKFYFEGKYDKRGNER